MLRSSILRSISSHHIFPSFPDKLIVNTLQAFAQMKHRVALAREQRVHADTAFHRQLLEAAPLEFVSDEYFALLAGQFAERKLQFIQKHVAEVERFRPGVGRWQ